MLYLNKKRRREEMKKLTINIPRDKVDYFMEVLEKGVEGTKNKHKQFVKSQIGRLRVFKYEYDSMIRMQRFHIRALLDGHIVRLNTVQDLDVVDAYTVKKEGDIVMVCYKERLLHEFKIADLFDKGCDCYLFIKGELKKVKLKFEELEEEIY